MKLNRNPEIILWIEAIGFILIITLSWANELLGLPQFLFGKPSTPNWHEALMETIVVLTIWPIVHLATSHLLSRLCYLEGFLRMCAWCRKIAHGDEWIPIEQYFDQKYATKTSHGICPQCAQNVLANEIPKSDE